MQVNFSDFRGLEVYKDIKERYAFRLEALQALTTPSDFYNMQWNDLNALLGEFYSQDLLDFARRAKKSILKYYKEQKDELEEDSFNAWINKTRGLDMLDLIIGTKEQKDEILRLLAVDFLRGLAFSLFDSYESENDEKLKALIEKIKANN